MSKIDSPFFAHSHAIVESERIGARTRVWAFAHILPGAVIGEDCNICDHVFIENDVHIGDRVTIKCGVQVWDGITLEDDVFVGPNVTFTNDRFPRSRVRPAAFAQTLVMTGASIGANATICPGVSIGKRAMIGAGAVVTRDVPADAIVVGNPATISGYVDSQRPVIAKPSPGPLRSLSVAGARLISLPLIEDMRGSLSFGEIGTHLPFAPKRYFIVWDVPSADVRGGHAHRVLDEVLVCLRGSCNVVIDNGTSREEVVLDSPTTALRLPPMVWAVQYKYSADAMLLVLASDVYDADDYIRDYDEYLSLVRTSPS